MSQEYKYPPDTSWIPAGGFRRGWQWGVGSITLSLVPFALLVVPGFLDHLELALACWFSGVIVGLLGLRERGTMRTIAWAGILMNICIPLIGWMLAPLLVGLMMSQGMR